MARTTSQDTASAGVGADVAHWQGRVVQRAGPGAEQRAIDAGTRLLRAATLVLARTNGASLTVQDVADEAGQSLRTLYQYFESKDDLLLAVFEEAMSTYARLIRSAITGLDDPVERLAGAIIASARVAARHDDAGRDRGLSQLRLQLTQAEPALIARAQEPLTALFHELVAAAHAASPSGIGIGIGIGIEQATYCIAALRTTFLLSTTLGNDLTVALPDVIDLSCFCLDGLGLTRPRPWHEDVDTRLRLS